ncbi:MAG: hypothetical protein QNJ97_07680 [Myxococcota bacterium]|nr:hypothetical protein [Myxococcota bacterium]
MTRNITTIQLIWSKIFGTRGLLGLALIALMAIAVFIPSSFAANQTKYLDKNKASSAYTSQVPEDLPREWNWEKPRISFDHMYPSK